MKKLVFLISMILLLISASAVSADSTVLVEQYVSYMCGGQFEVTFPDLLSSTHMVSNTTRVHAEATPDDRLIQLRIKMRNMTTDVLHGMSKESFRLTGFVRDRSISYYPEVITNTDYFGSGNYFTWDSLPPLRMVDILLVYRVNPILINWELNFEPVLPVESTYEFGNVTYTPMEYERCESATFQFPVLRINETGELIRYERTKLLNWIVSGE